jgi:menaquinone-9 beta-reductase
LVFSEKLFMKTDVLIIGGGPGGLAAGVALATCGLRVLLCERQRLPADQLCGEGLMPGGVVSLQQLGVASHLREADYHPFTGIRYHSPRGRSAAAEFAEGPGWGMRRSCLSAALLARTGDYPNLTIWDEVSAKPVERHQDYLLASAGARQVRARLLIGADGRNSTVRRWARLEGRSWHRRWGAGRHFQLRPWSNKVEVYWGAGLEAYVTPCGRDCVGVVFLWDSRRFQPARAGPELFGSFLQAFPSLEAKLAGAEALDAQRATGPLHRAATAPVADGVLLLGDAAGYLDALTGEGLSLALAQARVLTRCVAPRLRESTGLLAASDLNEYATAYRRIVRPYYRITRLALWLGQHKQALEWSIALLARRPGLFQKLLSAVGKPPAP